MSETESSTAPAQDGTRLPAPQPEDRAAMRKRGGALGRTLTLALSTCAHAALLAFLIPQNAEEVLSTAGGGGWAEEIELGQRDQASTGKEGEEAEAQKPGEPQAGRPETVQVELVEEPEPQVLAEEEDDSFQVAEAEEPEPEPEPQPEPEPEPEPEPIPDPPTPAPKPAPVADPAPEPADTPPEQPSESPGGGDGGQDRTDPGSPQGEDQDGAGEGNSDQPRIGEFIGPDTIRERLIGWTLIGTNGFADGSRPTDEDGSRREYEWQVYYDPSGDLDARYVRPAAYRPHGKIEPRRFSSDGEWWIEGDWLCQSMDKWFSGARTCFEVRADGNEIAMYYASCWGVPRCYKGRLGPKGIVVRGRNFR